MPRSLSTFAAAFLLWPSAALAASGAETPPCGSVIVPAGVGMNPNPQGAETLHPALYTGSLYENEAFQLLYRPLVWVSGDTTVDPVQSLASSITTNSDRTAFTVKLRPWHWSDGTSVTSADVLYDWQIIKALGPAYADYLVGGVPDAIRDVEATAPDTVVFTLNRPVNPEWFELAGLSQFYPLPRHAWARYSIAEQQTLQSEASFYAVVDGPYHLASFALGREAVFTPNEHYDGQHSRIGRFVIDFLGGSNPLEALESGQLDIATIPFALLDRTRRLTGLQHVTIENAPILSSIIPNLANPSLPFLDDARVRQAKPRPVDHNPRKASVFHGQAVEQHGFVPSAMTNFLAPDLRAGTSPLDYDPKAAALLLDQAGFHPDADGIRLDHGKPLAFTVLVTAGSEERLLMLQLAQVDLRRVGILLDIKEVEFNQLLARMLGPPEGWDAVFLAWTILTYPDPTAWFASGSTQNYEHYSDPEMDRLLRVATGSPDRQALFALQDYVLEQQPMIFLPDGFYSELARPGIDGIDKFLSRNGNWTPEYLTLSGAMACGAPHA